MPHNPNMTIESTSRNLTIVILAAGQGKRMKSAMPKVLHGIAGTPMLGHVLERAHELSPTSICVVYGHGGEQVRAAYPGANIQWALQSPQLGTGHAVMQALPHLYDEGITLILYGDVPLITGDTLAKLVDAAHHGKLAWLTQNVPDPTGLGRILRDTTGNVRSIVEDADASIDQRSIHEINTGFLACPTALLAKLLPKLTNNNAQGEYYLTDILALAIREGITVETPHPRHEWETVGVNNRAQLAQLERIFQGELAQRLMADGVTLADPSRIDIRGQLTCESDVRIDVNCVFEGKVHLASGASIGANCVLKDCTIGAKSEILPFSCLDGATIGANARIGPYTRIRPGTVLGDDVHLGNFVEVKASEFGFNSKANHLSYIGDTTVGAKVNIGAGTIVCNYDGANKHRSVIEDNVHIGSDVQLVAPITIGKGADIAAGTTVWKDVPPGGLTMNAKQQISKPDWKRPVKKT
jgi:bifunctional UDP-N-acetylglucosamine pyrophosphorylase / glucosamine-1-phosphate N-acetyltransferase